MARRGNTGCGNVKLSAMFAGWIFQLRVVETLSLSIVLSIEWQSCILWQLPSFVLIPFASSLPPALPPAFQVVNRLCLDARSLWKARSVKGVDEMALLSWRNSWNFFTIMRIEERLITHIQSIRWQFRLERSFTEKWKVTVSFFQEERASGLESYNHFAWIQVINSIIKNQ